MPLHKIRQEGFALLMTLIVVSVVISVGLTLLDLTIKQLKLSSGSKDSENSFHAANAGVECARYWRLTQEVSFETGVAVPVTCFGQAPVITTVQTLASGIYKYDFQITWSNSTRCSKISMITLSSDPSSLASSTLNNVPTYIPGYPFVRKECAPGGRCTIISAQGYNRSCGTINQIGTIQREVLLEL